MPDGSEGYETCDDVLRDKENPEEIFLRGEQVLLYQLRQVTPGINQGAYLHYITDYNIEDQIVFYRNRIISMFTFFL